MSLRIERRSCAGKLNWLPLRRRYATHRLLRDLLKPAELQAHLNDVLDAESLAAWPRTDTGKLTTRRQQLQLNSHLPALAELLQVRALQKLIDAFGESLIEAINPVTGRLHTSFLIAGASIRTLLRSWTKPAADAETA